MPTIFQRIHLPIVSHIGGDIHAQPVRPSGQTHALGTRAQRLHTFDEVVDVAMQCRFFGLECRPFESRA